MLIKLNSSNIQRRAHNVLLLVLFLQTLCPAHATEDSTPSLFHQLKSLLTRTLGGLLGFASLVFQSSNPPTTVDLIRKHGYPVETHYTKTEDGVILEIYRIPHGPMLEFFRLRRRIPVVLMHGIAQSSSDWFLNTPIKDSLGFLLSNEGYDVWIGNHRGILHKKSDLGNVSWNYSFHEMGVYDVPAILHYVSQYTGFTKVHYIGFSMSNTALMAALSKIPYLNSMIKVGIVLGPSIFQDNYYNGWLKLITPFTGVGEALQNKFGSVPILHPLAASILHRILPVICHPRVDLIGICLTVTNIIFGYDKGQITKEKLAQVTKVSPMPIASKLLLHYIQELASGRFCEYDYGPEKNIQVYGISKPPDYNLTNVVAPISIMVGPADALAHTKDSLTLANRLPNVVDYYLVPYQYFTHLDFCYAEDIGILLHNHVVEVLKRFD